MESIVALAVGLLSLVATGVGVIWRFSVIFNRVENAEKDIAKNREDFEKHVSKSDSLAKDIEEIKSDLKVLSARLSESIIKLLEKHDNQIENLSKEITDIKIKRNEN